MKLEILSKTRMRDRNNSIVTRYGCTILQEKAAEATPQSNVQITIISDELGTKDVGDKIELQ